MPAYSYHVEKKLPTKTISKVSLSVRDLFLFSFTNLDVFLLSFRELFDLPYVKSCIALHNNNRSAKSGSGSPSKKAGMSNICMLKLVSLC